MWVFYDPTTNRITSTAGATLATDYCPPHPGSVIYLDDAANATEYADIGNYIVQNGALVYSPVLTPAQQLANAQTAQVALVEAGYAATLNAGFTSSANGTATVYGYAQGDIQHMNMIATAMVANIETWPVDYADIHGTVVPLTQAQFTTLITDANRFNWAQITQLRSLVGNIMTATTVAAVQAIVWTPATY